jgi:hypothetical protein
MRRKTLLLISSRLVLLSLALNGLLAAAPAPAALQWASYLGGQDGESASGMALIGGEILVVGSTTSDDFPVTADAHDSSRDPGGIVGRDAFVARFSADASQLLYGTYLGGSGEDLATLVALLPTGEILVVGQTDSENFPVTAGAPFPDLAGGYDLFVARIDPGTGALASATYLGGGANDFPRDLLVEPGGSWVILGDTSSSDFPASEADGDGTLDGPTDLFVARFSPEGLLAEARFVGGSGSESGGGIGRGADGGLWLVGSTSSPDIPVTVSGPGAALQGGYDALALRLSEDLRTLKAATYLGGADDDRGRDVACSPEGSTVVAYGTTESDDFPLTSGAIQATRRGRDLFVTGLSTEELSVVASTYFGTVGTDTAHRLHVDASGAVVLAGSGLQGGAPTTPGAADLDGHPGCNPYCFADALVARLNASLTRVHYATYLASSNGDSATDLVGSVELAIVGASGGSDFPTTDGVFGEEVNLGHSGGGADAFAARLDLGASVPDLHLSADEVSWLPLPGAEGYDVLRGDLSVLRQEGGDWSASVELCLADSSAGTTAAVPGEPDPGGAWWILVRAERSGTPTSYDAVTAAQRGTRDDGIEAAPESCP